METRSERASVAKLPHSMEIQMEIQAERALQREEFDVGGDDALLPAEWIARIVKHTGRAVSPAPFVYRRQLVVIAALAIAALEAHDRKYALEIE